MLSIDEFNSAASVYIRRMRIVAGVSFAGMLGCFALAASLRPALYELINAQWGVPGAEAFFGVIYLVAVGVFITGMLLGDRRASKDERLHCPHCGVLLVQRRPIVVASRNCVQCGRRVLAEPV